MNDRIRYYDKKLTEPESLNPFIENLMDPFKFKSSTRA